MTTNHIWIRGETRMQPRELVIPSRLIKAQGEALSDAIRQAESKIAKRVDSKTQRP